MKVRVGDYFSNTFCQDFAVRLEELSNSNHEPGEVPLVELI